MCLSKNNVEKLNEHKLPNKINFIRKNNSFVVYIWFYIENNKHKFKNITIKIKLKEKLINEWILEHLNIGQFDFYCCYVWFF